MTWKGNTISAPSPLDDEDGCPPLQQKDAAGRGALAKTAKSG